VRHATDGVAALEEVRRGRPDLVLLDVMMPRMNGILFLQSLRAQPDMRDVPVVILSNFREPRLVDRAMALGALEYVVKAQTRPDVLVGAVPRWIAGERAFST
jgi:CheY-like chemotaxis protein